jgi:Na+/melibiose symporter-like transporter
LLVMFWEGSVQQFFIPAQQAMVPRLVAEEQLLTANALSGQVDDISRLAGSGLGGVIAAAGGITAVALADTASFIAAIALLAVVSTSGRTTSRQAGRQLKRIAAELSDGLRLAAGHRVIRTLMVFVLITSIGQGIFSTLFPPFVEHVLHGSSQEYGIVVGAQAVGGILGGALALVLGQRFSPKRLFSCGAIAFGAIDLAIFLYPLGYVAVWPAVIGMILTGVPSALNLAGLVTLFQQNTEDAYRGRIFGAISAAEGITILAGTLCVGVLGHSLGIIAVLAVQGAGYAIAGLAMLLWLQPATAPVLAA